MFKLSVMFLLLCFTGLAQNDFSAYFHDKALRIDYIRSGNKTADHIFIKELREEPYWGGSLINLVDRFDYGKYKIEVSDKETGKVLYTRHYSTLFSEWQTTDEALKIDKAFEESMQVPFPKRAVVVTFYGRDKNNVLQKNYSLDVNPDDYFIIKENRFPFDTLKVHYSGNPHTKVDIVIIPDGYTADEMSKFEADCQKFSQYLFNSSPYKEQKDNFNIWGVKAISAESGTDIPKAGVYRNTILESKFYTFDTERYLMTESYFRVRDVAANVPYDQIFILVNSAKYGGGAIYNYYSVCINNNKAEEYIFVHEFGHGFAFLGDEYYTSSTSYNDFYPAGVEPLEENLTTLVNFDKKWKGMMDTATPIPTPAEEKYQNILGVFEGGGYVAKGVYRPRMDCSMFSISVDNFCPVCSNAILNLIKFYSE